MIDSQNLLRPVYGIDFSGAKSAGKRIWIAGGTVKEDILTIKNCFKAEALPGAGKDREGCLTALRRFIEKEKIALSVSIFLSGCQENWYEKEAGMILRYIFPGNIEALKISGQNAVKLHTTGNSKEPQT